jgi:hypothetical protein
MDQGEQRDMRKGRRIMVPENVTEFSNRAYEAWREALDKTLEAFSLASEANRNLSSQAVEATAAIAREGVQYLGEVQGSIRQASEEAREFLVRQWTLAQEYPKDPVGTPQKAVALSWEGGEKVTRLGDAQVEALNRFNGNVQHLLEKASKENRETVATHTEKILNLYDLKN